MRHRKGTAPARLRVDPIACDGIGICAHLAPTLIVLDTWGYPIVTGALSGRADLRAARAATAACPRRALLVETDPPPGQHPVVRPSPRRTPNTPP